MQPTQTPTAARTIRELEAALEPFASFYKSPGMDLSINPDWMPVVQFVGADGQEVVLRMGDFKRAHEVLTGTDKVRQ